MSADVIVFFNSRSGVGKTSLVYHLAWMYADQGKRVIAADFDPQANLTAAFLDEDELQKWWPESGPRRTVYGSIEPLLRGAADVAPPHVAQVADGIGLLVGDVALAGFEHDLCSQWPLARAGEERALQVTTALSSLLVRAARDSGADLVLVDTGPNLGAINRAALVGADHVVIPISPDLPSLQSLRSMGPALRTWREEWRRRRADGSVRSVDLPAGSMLPVGYVVLLHAIRYDRTAGLNRPISQVPAIYEEAVLGRSSDRHHSIDDDPNRLGLFMPSATLMFMSQEARRPIFHLTTADGAVGSFQQAVARAYDDFERLARRIEERLRAQPSGS